MGLICTLLLCSALHVSSRVCRLSMCFVTAASNLRSVIFDIEPMSFHDAKGVAGNIIPAIASTNAIIAGLQVAQAVHLLGKLSRCAALTCFALLCLALLLISLSHSLSPIRSLLVFVSLVWRRGEVLAKETCKAVFCQRFPTRRGYYLQPIESSPPSDTCYVCSSNQQTLEVRNGKCDKTHANSVFSINLCTHIGATSSCRSTPRRGAWETSSRESSRAGWGWWSPP